MKSRKKRAAGEGTMFRRKSDGRWVGKVTVAYVSGRQRVKSVYGASQAEVKTKLTTLRHSLQQGLPVTNDRLTVGPFLTTWLEHVTKPKVRPKTHKCY